MLPSIVILATKGGLMGHEFEFTGRKRCVVGRGSDCEVQVPRGDLTASRHHCLLDIDPPSLTLYDLASRNGTYVNGERLSPAASSQVPPTPVPGSSRGQPLKVGDEIRVGDTTLRVWLVEAPKAPRTG
jgi:pSer/pThr/pTyr-binding forkhead associated (FHA) protein